MLVIPFDRRLDWRRPPLVTLALVLLNVLVFFLFQEGDDRRLQIAVDYYYGSGLHALELSRYRDQLLAEGELDLVVDFEAQLDAPDDSWLFRMLADATFMRQLLADEVITPADPEHGRWRAQRAEFERLLAEVRSFGFGFVPAQPRGVAVLTYMFLHADLGHLLGNMFFLFAVGFLVEGALGRGVYLLAYLLCGFGALGLFVLVEPAAAIPLVGASGAISGVMGMYAVLFGRRRVSFFYYLLVYFDYVKAPAILLLGLWLGYELLQYVWLAPDSPVAYMAHVGGLLSGAVLALLLKRLPRVVDETYLAENDQADARQVRFAQAVADMERFDFAKAVPVLEELLHEQPDDHALLTRLLTCTRFQPAGEAYHRTAQRILVLTATDPETDRLVLETYRDYLQRAKPKSRLSADCVRRLLPRFVRLQELVEAERLLAVMLRNPQAFPDTPSALAQVANSLLKHQQAARARRYLLILLERFPAAPEAALARRVLQV